MPKKSSKTLREWCIENKREKKCVTKNIFNVLHIMNIKYKEKNL